MLRYVGLTVATLMALSGCTGDKGDKGDTGATGPDGSAGPAGPAGANGPAGPAGPAGKDGATGPTGATGAAGATDIGEAGAGNTPTGPIDGAAKFPTKTGIKHVVVIFGENISYDHYFATYPNSANLPGELEFTAKTGTPTPNNLQTPADVTSPAFPADTTAPNLLTANPNFTNAANGTGVQNPFRFLPSQGSTMDMGHNYMPEQQASHAGAMDLFPEFVGHPGPPPGAGVPASNGLVMGYYDGNTVTAIWNYAQAYAMNDNSWSTVFGPSTPGAINLISGQTNGFAAVNKDAATMGATHVVADGNGDFTLIGDTDPLNDVCSTAGDQNLMKGKNIGDLLNEKNITWGWFEGGFDLTLTNANGTTGCNRSSTTAHGGAAPVTSADYIPHHQPFQYYASTQNKTHARPSSVSAIGHTFEADGVSPDPANHQYDSHDFFDAVKIGNVPALSYVKAPGYQDGHAGYSTPGDEQDFIISVVNALASSPEWASTAIILAYDDSDGWYDHQAPPIVNRSSTTVDQLNSAGVCNLGKQQPGTSTVPTAPLLGANGMPAQGRCGYGTRQPLLVISPFAKTNYVDHTLTDQSSILKFVEDNWLGGERVQPGGSFDTIAGSIENMLK